MYDEQTRQTYFFTFGYNTPNRNAWIEIEANTEKDARDEMFRLCGDKWAFCYTEKTFTPHLYPDGRLGNKIILP